MGVLIFKGAIAGTDLKGNHICWGSNRFLTTPIYVCGHDWWFISQYSYCGWTTSISRHFETVVKTLEFWMIPLSMRHFETTVGIWRGIESNTWVSLTCDIRGFRNEPYTWSPEGFPMESPRQVVQDQSPDSCFGKTPPTPRGPSKRKLIIHVPPLRCLA